MNMFSSKTASDAIPAVPHVSSEMLQTASKAVDSTREFANDALDQAESTVRAFRHNIDPVGDMLAATAQKLAKQSLDMASDAKDYAQHALNRAAKVSTRYVSDQPVRSVLMAAAVGAAVATLISYARGGRSHNRY
ncbi:MAG: hypothetical protein Q7T07_15070 [Burkholderiaceae bacterium]|nr:hypothetical protein [Burkholderiaceae bacterium]